MILIWKNLNRRVKADVLEMFGIVAIVIGLALFSFSIYTAVKVSGMDFSSTLSSAAFISMTACFVMILWIPFYWALHFLKKLRYWHLVGFAIGISISIILAAVPAIQAKDYMKENFYKVEYLKNLRDNILNNNDASTWVKFDVDEQCCNWNGAMDITNSSLVGDEAQAKVEEKIDDDKFLNSLVSCYHLEGKESISLVKINEDNKTRFEVIQMGKEKLEIQGCGEILKKRVGQAITGIGAVCIVVVILSFSLLVIFIIYVSKAVLQKDEYLVRVEDEGKFDDTKSSILSMEPSESRQPIITASEELKAEVAGLMEGRRQSLKTPAVPKSVTFD